jgi:hypothetical protein
LKSTTKEKDSMEISASQFLECGDRIREELLDLLFGGLGNEISDNTYGYAGVASAFDRAMIAALKLGGREPSPPQATEKLHGPLKPGPKVGSAAARKRAQKAAATRAANKAAHGTGVQTRPSTMPPTITGIPGTGSTQFAGDGKDGE